MRRQPPKDFESVCSYSELNGDSPTKLHQQPINDSCASPDVKEGDGVFRIDPTITSNILKYKDNSSFWERWNEFWFPHNVPRACQLFRKENIAVPACYLLVGLLQGLSGPLINVLPLDMGASEAQQVTVAILTQLPSSFKMFFGFLSDTVPLFGYRRKSYMVIGWLITSFAALVLLYVIGSDLKKVTPASSNCFSSLDGAQNYENYNDMQQDGNDDGMIFEDAPESPMIRFLALCFLIYGCGVWMADVMADAVVAEKAKLEPIESRGSLQSTCYSYRFFGVMCAVPVSTYLYTAYGPYYVILLLSILPLMVLPAIYSLEEVIPLGYKSTWEHCLEIWHTVCSRATWQPMGFVFLYKTLQVSNAAGKEFSRTVLHFSSCQLNLMFFVALLLLYVGILMYKYCWIQSSWRTVYLITTAFGLLFGGLHLMLIYGHTLGLPPFWFAVGQNAFSEFVEGVQFLPTTIMMVHLCPEGSEVRPAVHEYNMWEESFVLLIILCTCSMLPKGCKLCLIHLGDEHWIDVECDSIHCFVRNMGCVEANLATGKLRWNGQVDLFSHCD